ncbi:MAG TPA: group 1 truncated hemoglobin [Gammaproteobacteria bacterium]|nr:group 1 truncated hemoglobin [Gammaproteobacteria bacterium]
MSESLYDRIGGDAAVNAAVDVFYRKVLADDRINMFFEGVDMDKQAAKQKAFLTFAFGGPNNYSGKDMREGHAHLVARGLNDSHFDAVVENLGATLKELGVPDELIQEAAAIAESTRNDVLGR